MRNRWVAAAAAAMMTIGGAGGAQAYIVHVFGGGGGTPADGYILADFTFDTTGVRPSSGYYEEGYQEEDFIHEYAYRLVAGDISGSVSFDTAPGYSKTTVSAVFTNYSVVDVGPDPIPPANYPTGPYGVFAEVIYQDGVKISTINDLGQFGDVTIVVSTPLPSGAPMFGGALIALALANYARRVRTSA